jgi:hypothetical protein
LLQIGHVVLRRPQRERPALNDWFPVGTTTLVPALRIEKRNALVVPVNDKLLEIAQHCRVLSDHTLDQAPLESFGKSLSVLKRSRAVCRAPTNLPCLATVEESRCQAGKLFQRKTPPERGSSVPGKRLCYWARGAACPVVSSGRGPDTPVAGAGA